MIFIVFVVILIFTGVFMSISQMAGSPNLDLLKSDNDREFFLENFKDRKVELKRIQIVFQLAGKSARTRTVSLDAPFPAYSKIATINDYLQIVEIGRIRDKVLFSIGYSEEDKENLRELMNCLSVP